MKENTLILEELPKEELPKEETYGLPAKIIQEIRDDAKKFKHDAARVKLIMKHRAQVIEHYRVNVT